MVVTTTLLINSRPIESRRAVRSCKLIYSRPRSSSHHRMTGIPFSTPAVCCTSVASHKFSLGYNENRFAPSSKRRVSLFHDTDDIALQYHPREVTDLLTGISFTTSYLKVVRATDRRHVPRSLQLVSQSRPGLTANVVLCD